MSYQLVTPTQEQLDELESKHGDLLVLQGGKRSAYLMVFRRPTRQETIGYKLHVKKDATTASEALCKRIVVFPDKPVLDELLDKFGFAADFCLNSEEFQDFTGMANAAELK